MSAQTKIEWATHTFNPWEGCTKVSPGCAHCYAETRNHRFGMDNWGKGKPRRRTSNANWRKPLKWNEEAGVEGPMRQWPVGFRPRVFPSLCDWLDEVPIEWLADFLKLIHDTPNLDWLLLTKRPENFFQRLIEASLHLGGWRDGQMMDIPIARTDDAGLKFAMDWSKELITPANVWIGTSIEDQQRADERIPKLLDIPARLRFLSVEPLLGPVCLRMRDRRGIGETGASYGPGPIGFQWVIVGGESGPGARLCDGEWIRSIIAQCKAASVPCFVKQLGAHSGVTWSHGPGQGSPLPIKHSKGGDPAEWPEALRVREFPAAIPTTNQVAGLSLHVGL